MRIKTMVILLIAIILTITLMQNTGPIWFKFLFMTISMSKLVVLLIFTGFGFALGMLIGRKKKTGYNISAYHDEIHKEDEPGTLSDEDREYIS